MKRLLASLLIMGLLTSLIPMGKAENIRKVDIIETTAPTMDLFDFDAFDQNGLAHIRGKLTNFEDRYIDKYGQMAFQFSNEYYYYYLDKNGTYVILARNFSSDGSISYSTNKNNGLVDSRGKVLLEPIYDYIGWFSEGLAVIKKDGKAGYINAKGEFVLPMVYEDAGAFSEGFAAAKRGNKWGYIDLNGQWVIKPQFYSAERFYEGLALVQKDYFTYGFIDRSGKPAFDKTFDFAFGFNRGLATVEIDDKWGAVDTSGNVVVPLDYFQLNDYGNEFLHAKLQTSGGIKEGMVDRSGNVRIPVEYDLVYMNDEAGLITVGKAGKWGVVDKENNIVIPIEHSEAIYFHGGYAKAQKDNKYGYFDTSGKLGIPFMYDAGLNFFAGVTSVMKNGVWTMIDKQNNDLGITKMQDEKYDQFWDFSYGLAQTKKGGKWGVIQLKEYPDTWAQPEVTNAIAKGLVPESMQYYYPTDITRERIL